MGAAWSFYSQLPVDWDKKTKRTVRVDVYRAVVDRACVFGAAELGRKNEEALVECLFAFFARQQLAAVPKNVIAAARQFEADGQCIVSIDSYLSLLEE